MESTAAVETVTEHPYVVRNPKILSGEPIVKGTRTPVRALVQQWRLGTSIEELPDAYPHLTMAQVLDALSYFSDHPHEIEAHIARNHIPDELVDPRALGR